MAALLAYRPQATAAEQRAISRTTVQLLILALLTQLVYPIFYYGYIGTRGHAMIILSTLVATVRNVALVVFTVEACWIAWRFLGAPVRDETTLTHRE